MLDLFFFAGKGVQIGQGVGGSPVKLTPGTPTFLSSTGLISLLGIHLWSSLIF